MTSQHKPTPDGPLGELIAGRIDQAEYRRRLRAQAHRQARYEDLELRGDEPIYVVDVEPDFRIPIVDDRPRHPLLTWTLLVAIVLIAIVAFVIANRSAAPRGAQTTEPTPSRDLSAAPALSAGLPGAPLVSDGVTTTAPGGAPQTQTGVASWYDVGPGYYAAAPWWSSGMDPVPVSVCRIDAGRSDCISVVVQDHCQCLVGTSRARIIDLSADAFAELAPLSVGLIRVQVDRGAGPTVTLPPTDVAP